MLLSISFSVAAEHVRHFQFRTVHAWRLSETLRSGWLRFNRDGMRQQIERAGCRAHFAGGDSQVLGGGRQAAMPEQQLNRTDIGSGLQQMHCKGVAHGMGSYGLANAGNPTGTLAGILHGAPGNRSPGNFARE